MCRRVETASLSGLLKILLVVELLSNEVQL